MDASPIVHSWMREALSGGTCRRSRFASSTLRAVAVRSALIAKTLAAIAASAAGLAHAQPQSITLPVTVTAQCAESPTVSVPLSRAQIVIRRSDGAEVRGTTDPTGSTIIGVPNRGASHKIAMLPPPGSTARLMLVYVHFGPGDPPGRQWAERDGTVTMSFHESTTRIEIRTETANCSEVRTATPVPPPRPVPPVVTPPPPPTTATQACIPALADEYVRIMNAKAAIEAQLRLPDVDPFDQAGRALVATGIAALDRTASAAAEGLARVGDGIAIAVEAGLEESIVRKGAVDDYEGMERDTELALRLRRARENVGPMLEDWARQFRAKSESARAVGRDLPGNTPASRQRLQRLLDQMDLRKLGHEDRAHEFNCRLPTVASPPSGTRPEALVIGLHPPLDPGAPIPNEQFSRADLISMQILMAWMTQRDKAFLNPLRDVTEMLALSQGTVINATLQTGRERPPGVRTPEATVTPNGTAWLVHRDPARQLTFVYVNEGMVTIAPTRGASLQVGAGQAALVLAKGARLLKPRATATAGGTAGGGTAGGAGGATSGTSTFEADTDRKGSDLANFDLPAPQPQLCRERCEGNPNCRAWTYVKPGVQGANARCWLKNAIPPAVRDGCCVSGTVAGGATPQPPPPPVRLPNGDIRYDNPTVGGIAVDHCASWATHCGQGGADAFCRRQSHPGAVSFRVRNPGRTFVLADQRVCEGGNCVGFSEVVCAGNATNPPAPPPITERTCWDWSGQLKNGAVVRSKVEMFPNGVINAPAWGMRGTIRNIGGNRYQVSWNGRGPGQEDNLTMDAAGVLSGANYETNWIRAARTACDANTVAPPPPPPPPPAPPPPAPPLITGMTCWDWSGQLKNGAVVRSKVEMFPNGVINAPAWGMRGTIRNIGGNRYQVSWNGRGPGQEDNLTMDAAGVLSGANFETNWIRAARMNC